MSKEIAVTKYILNHSFELKYKVQSSTLCDFNICDDLNIIRSKISASKCGKLIEIILCERVKFFNKDLSNVIRSFGIEPSYISDNIYNYIDNVIHKLNLNMIQTQRKFTFHINNDTLIACPDIISNDDEIYDIKVVNQVSSKNIDKQLYLYYHGFKQAYKKPTKCGIINLYTNMLVEYEFEDLNDDEFKLIKNEEVKIDESKNEEVKIDESKNEEVKTELIDVSKNKEIFTCKGDNEQGLKSVIGIASITLLFVLAFTVIDMILSIIILYRL